MNRTLFPAEVQRAIFNQLITYEHLLEDGYIMVINRPSSGKFWTYVYPDGHPELSSVAMISTRSLTTAKKLDEAVARWWKKHTKRMEKITAMNTLPYLDTEEKLRTYVKEHWNLDIEPSLISAHAADNSVLIFPSAAYHQLYAQVNCSFASMGQITYKQQALVHPCVIPVLQEAYRKKRSSGQRIKPKTHTRTCIVGAERNGTS